MRRYYRQILTENADSGMLIARDSSCILCYNDDEFSLLAPYQQSVTQRICTQTEDISLNAADVTAALHDYGTSSVQLSDLEKYGAVIAAPYDDNG